MTSGSPLRRSSLPISALIHDEDQQPTTLSAPIPQTIWKQSLPVGNPVLAHRGCNTPSLLAVETQMHSQAPEIPLYSLCIFTTSTSIDSPIFNTAGPSSPDTIPVSSPGSISASSSTSLDAESSLEAFVPPRATHRARALRRYSPRRHKARPTALTPRPGGERILKGPWKPAETAQLAALVAEHGASQWSQIANHIPGRTGKQARERWKNHLDPELKKGGWTAEEDSIILRLFARVGKKWSTIARELPGRSDNDVKNRYNGALSDQKDKSTAQCTRADVVCKSRGKLSNLGSPVRRTRLFEEIDGERPSIFNMYC